MVINRFRADCLPDFLHSIQLKTELVRLDAIFWSRESSSDYKFFPCPTQLKFLFWSIFHLFISFQLKFNTTELSWKILNPNDTGNSCVLQPDIIVIIILRRIWFWDRRIHSSVQVTSNDWYIISGTCGTVYTISIWLNQPTHSALSGKHRFRSRNRFDDQRLSEEDKNRIFFKIPSIEFLNLITRNDEFK